MQKKAPKYDLMIILSGPEPQQGILEEKLKPSPTIQRQCGFIKGVVQAHQVKNKLTLFAIIILYDYSANWNKHLTK
jgi:hypothetical protein